MALAQIDPYARVLDPIAIAYLGGTDTLRSHHIAYVGNGFGLEPDSSRLFAAFDGPGIVTHFWDTDPRPGFNNDGEMRMYIDDRLIYAGTIAGYFLKKTGRLRPPLDTTYSGGLVSNVQMGFKRSFRMTIKGTGTIFAMSWREVADSSLVESFDPMDTTGLSSQVGAESVMRKGEIPTTTANLEVTGALLNIAADSKTVLLRTSGRGIIRSLEIKPENFSAEVYRDVWLQCRWDGDPTAAIEVPLADLFGSASGLVRLNALQLKVLGYNTPLTPTLRCTLPMPFENGAEIVLVNKGKLAVSLMASAAIDRNVQDLSEFGRLHMQFNEVASPRMGHFLPIAHAKGRGRVFGVIFNIPEENAAPSYLEGDPLLTIDSSSEYFLRYPGTEDYFGGGWYFRDSIFSEPFFGAPKLWNSMYRFHYLDVINFDRSIDWIWQHGANNDFAVHYRTISLLYLQPLPFRISSDSLVLGATLKIDGWKYKSAETIELEIGPIKRTLTANDQGKFSALIGTASLGLGSHRLTINDVEYPMPITVLLQPTIDDVIDSQYRDLSMFDSIEVRLNGFSPHTPVNILLGEHIAQEKVIVDERGSRVVSVKMPVTDSGSYDLQANYNGAFIKAAHPINVTRTLRYEIEDLPLIAADCYNKIEYLGWFGYDTWSNATIRFVYPERQGQGITLSFDVPYSDNYHIDLSATKGLRYANMGVAVDGIDVGVVPGFFRDNYNTPHVSPHNALGALWINRGNHSLTLTSNDRDTAAVEWCIGPDVLFLTPLRDAISHVELLPFSNPLLRIINSPGNEIRFELLNTHSIADPEFAIFDILGRNVKTIVRGSTGLGHNGSIPTAELPAGSYILVYRDRSTNAFAAASFVIGQ